ncbi:magnesium transporter CorA family protein [Neptunicella marina]|uniref:Magnesium transporter CorA family protein n=1 Tax=Neptunicella marina TaxID=2125989 RepID=A0A8J6M8E0_9ALTE|nr:magnesium transporter CorA family protein [Neptunicella marina]MBC3767736.1 magnesium transporter CorA family protein [Neptunicella marina]
MIRTQLLDQHGDIQHGQQDLIAQLTDKHKIWIDIELNNNNRDMVQSLLTERGCHPLAIEDALRARHPPKIEFFDEHIFILYRGVLAINADLDITHLQLAFFVSGNCVISVRHGHSKGIDKVWGTKQRYLSESPLHVALKVMHASAGVYLEQILEFESNLSDMEDEFLQRGNDQMMAELVSYRSRLVKLRRVFNYHTGISDVLQSEYALESTYISPQHHHDIIDLKDRFDRLYTLVQMHYEICGDLLDGYLSISSHQLNNTMRVLTVITAIFVPLSFLAGLYGMNFEVIPELKWKYGYFILLGVMAIIAISLLTFFKKRRWM